MSSSSESLTLTSPRSSGTTKSVVLVHQPPGQVVPQTNLQSTQSKESVRRQICVVVRNLEAVVLELNSVMNELQGVLEQIDKVTSCLDSRLSGRLFSLQHSTDDEKLWTARRKRSVSSACSISTHPSKSNSSTTTTSTSSSSTDLSSLWKLPRRSRSRSSSSGKPSQKRTKRNVESIANSNHERQNQDKSLKNVETKRQSNHLQRHEPLELRLNETKDKTRPREEMKTEVRLREKKRNHKRAFLHGICCVRTQSMYSAESDARRSFLSDDGAWVLRKGNGVKSPMYSGVLLPVEVGNQEHVKQPQRLSRSFSDGNISSCSGSRDNRRRAAANLKLRNSREPSLNHTPIRTSGIASLSDETLYTNSSREFLRKNVNQRSLLLNLDDNEHIPLMTYLRSPVTCAHMHRRSDNLDEGDRPFLNGLWSSRKRQRDAASYTRKPKNGIYQYESETELSQRGMNLSDKEGSGAMCSPVSDQSVTISIGPTLSEIEPDMVATDTEVEFSLMPTIPAEKHKMNKEGDLKEVQKSSSSLIYDNHPSISGSFSSLPESEDGKRRYRIYSYDSEGDRTDRVLDRESQHKREKLLAAEGLKLLLYGNDGKSTEDISEQRQKIMAELDNLKLSFNSTLSTPESENEKLLRRSLTQFDDFSPDSHKPLMLLAETVDPNSPGSNGESPLSNGYEADPEVKEFLQELERKIKERGSKSGSIDNMSGFTGSRESLALSDNIFTGKLTRTILDENSNIKLNSMFRSSMDSVLTEDSIKGCSSDPGDSDHMMESFEWEHSFTFSMYKESGADIPDLSPEEKDADKTLESNFTKSFDLDEALTYSLSYPLDKAKSTSLSSSESFIWSEGSITADRRLDSTGKSVDELLSELNISADLLSKSTLKRPETLVPSIDQRKSESLPRSEGNPSEYKVSYNRDINTWTAFAMVHIGGSDTNLSRCSAASDGTSNTSGKSNKAFSPQDGLAKTNAKTEIHS